LRSVLGARSVAVVSLVVLLLVPAVPLGTRPEVAPLLLDGSEGAPLVVLLGDFGASMPDLLCALGAVFMEPAGA
jgi:hypothetical protein